MAVSVTDLDRGAPRSGEAALGLRVRLTGGATTTVHIAAYALEACEPRVVVLPRPEPLVSWCRRTGTADAVVGGFFVRTQGGRPLGELRTHGVLRRHVPFDGPWAASRSCLHVEAGGMRLLPRDELPAKPRGDLLQAGPLLVREGRPQVTEGGDPEGFSSGRAQFDSDITVGRYPRAALGVRDGIAWAVACDGRAEDDAGLTLAELASLMAALGADTAINLDGGGSTSLVCGGRLVNRPRAEHGIDLPEGRPISTALTFVPRD